MRNDHVDFEMDQLSSEVRESIELPLRAPDLERKVLAFDVPQLLQPLLEGVVGREAKGKGDEKADPKAFPWRLRVGRERCHEDGEGQRRNEPNAIEPHGDLLLRHGLPLIWCSRTARHQARLEAGAQWTL